MLNTDIKAGTLVNNNISSKELKDQQNMIQNAFAGDNVEEQFNAEKQRLVDEDSTEKRFQHWLDGVAGQVKVHQHQK